MRGGGGPAGEGIDMPLPWNPSFEKNCQNLYSPQGSENLCFWDYLNTSSWTVEIWSDLNSMSTLFSPRGIKLGLPGPSIIVSSFLNPGHMEALYQTPQCLGSLPSDLEAGWQLLTCDLGSPAWTTPQPML